VKLLVNHTHSSCRTPACCPVRFCAIGRFLATKQTESEVLNVENEVVTCIGYHVFKKYITRRIAFLSSKLHAVLHFQTSNYTVHCILVYCIYNADRAFEQVPALRNAVVIKFWYVYYLWAIASKQFQRRLCVLV